MKACSKVTYGSYYFHAARVADSCSWSDFPWLALHGLIRAFILVQIWVFLSTWWHIYGTVGLAYFWQCQVPLARWCKPIEILIFCTFVYFMKCSIYLLLSGLACEAGSWWAHSTPACWHPRELFGVRSHSCAALWVLEVRLSQLLTRIIAAIQRSLHPLFQYIMMKFAFSWPLWLYSLPRYSEFLAWIHISEKV